MAAGRSTAWPPDPKEGAIIPAGCRPFRGKMRRSAVFLLVAFLGTLWGASPALPSQLIARDAKDVRLAVDRWGRALVTYRAQGRLHRVLAWGAIDAVLPSSGRPQARFRLDYAGGWGTFQRPIWKTFPGVCLPYDGPPLAWLVVACKAPDGSYWALQSWQRLLPNYGLTPATRLQSAWELRLSHWRGPLPVLEIEVGWAYRRFHQIYGRLTYRGQPVHGFRSTSSGVPLDGHGRNIYLDTLDSSYGPGWRRENSFLTHVGTGGFCYGLYPHGDRPPGRGKRYRATVIGPGVTPDVAWEGTGPEVYDPAFDRAADARLLALLAGDRLCRPR
ncbi:MAG: hypothetical protein C4306_10635 [Thermoleophilia bacterium]